MFDYFITIYLLYYNWIFITWKKVYNFYIFEWQSFNFNDVKMLLKIYTDHTYTLIFTTKYKKRINHYYI